MDKYIFTFLFLTTGQEITDSNISKFKVGQGTL